MKDRKLEISPPPLLTYFNKIPPPLSPQRRSMPAPPPSHIILPSAMECIPVKQLLGKGALKTNTKILQQIFEI